jgi:hypothetical protein
MRDVVRTCEVTSSIRPLRAWCDSRAGYVGQDPNNSQTWGTYNGGGSRSVGEAGQY